MWNLKTASSGILLVVSAAFAHLAPNSLTPGPGTLTVGQSVTITWTVQQAHPDNPNAIDIALSKDGGKTWSSIKAGYVDDKAEQKTFRWNPIPSDAATATGKFRICQSGPCTNADSVSQPTRNRSPWVLISAPFAIQAATGLAPLSGSASRLKVGFDPGTRNVDVSFGMDKAGPVLLEAFDSQGRLAATLIDGKYGAGDHRVSAFSNRLAGASGSLVFKLKAGDQVETHTWMALR